MKKVKLYSMLQALLSALLFAAGAPISKILLDDIEPISLAAFTYLGSGIGLFFFRRAVPLRENNEECEAQISKSDIKWLIGAVLAGGIIAPILLMYGLRVTPGATASLLLNFEGVATIAIAGLIFKEAVGRRIYSAIALITIASIILTFNFRDNWGFSTGGLGIIGACVLWGIDNNLTKNISEKDPFAIVTIKGIGAGLFSLVLSFLAGSGFPGIHHILPAMLVGFFSYGLSIVLFIYAMRGLGASRTGILFGTSPFLGVILSFILLKEIPDFKFYFSLPLMIIGAVLILSEKHTHKHTHCILEHEHRHSHDDGHHLHTHKEGIDIEHSHIHRHEASEHIHKHTPDIHHNHQHK
ncbi:EamA-like transporter family protein [Ruminiclostridium hungatei]|uniref:EamA-like transporter family protein n=1 Tax=Ruminiclostridium hungatei TaxID=48256 RepID=A0A1V4SRI6_RUMHU|nr:DMT family transporter [Ruminiclostridium hungatei]OPX45901.1 EamA-like transporter family protein [Ruminiclostridium hungatei]